MSEWVIVSEGVRRRILQDGEQLMLVQFEFEPGKSVPLHNHHHEQISYVISGKMDFNRDGEVVEVGPGQSIRMPSNVKHGATSREASVLLETFSPPREDFRQEARVSMERIIVASTNPVKIQAALNGFQTLFPDRSFTADGIDVPSGVSAQPRSSAETLQGALNRARHARQHIPDAGYWVGIEGGVEEVNGEMGAFAWIVVQADGKIGKSMTGVFYLPQEVVRLVHQGYELGDADDIVFGRSNSKQQNGSVGLLTDNVITRLSYYEHAVILALVPFKNPALSFG